MRKSLKRKTGSYQQDYEMKLEMEPSDKGRNVARQMGIDIEGIEADIKDQAQSRQNATEDNV
ncbi:MAG: hypothetical protein K1W16_04955 [Lachnospiraceae bacterium]|jgi:hypothetical protein